DQQEKIAQVIELLASGSNAAERTVRVFRLNPDRVDLTSMMSGLQAVLPSQIRLEPNTANNTILAIGSASELEQVAKKIEELQQQIPEPDVSATRVYSLRHGSTVGAVTVLQTMLPKATIVQDLATRTISATAKIGEHERIAEFLKSYDMPREPATYLVKPTQAVVVQTSLKALFPYADITSDPTTGQLVVVAEQEQQKQIAKVVEMMGSGPNATERTVRVFKVASEREDLTALVNTLQSTLPSQIRLESSNRNQTILAIGTPEELDLVAVKLEEVQKQLPLPEPITSVVYPLNHGTPAGAYTLLTNLLPRATIVQDPTSRTIAATARRSDHDKIRDLIATYDIPRQEMLEMQVYRLKQGSAYGLASVLVTLMPQGSFYGGREDGILVATATKDQHARIQEIISGYERGAEGIQTKVFPMGKADATTLRTALAASSTKINVVADVATNSLIVTAPASDMQRISEVVKTIDQGDGSDKTSRYYPLNSADPTALARALSDSFPKSKIGADSTNGGIFVTGTEPDHEAIAKVVQEVNQQPGKLPSFKAFPLQYANPETLAKSLTTALGSRSATGITFNREAKSVFAVGSKQDLSNLEQMIAQMDTPESRDNARRLEIFSLKGVDGKSVATSLESLFKDSSLPAEVKFDQFNQQLFVTGDAKQMALVSEALQKITPPKRDLEVFQLENADPNSIKIAADALFADEPVISMPNVTTDTNQQQVWVRGTRDQIESVRKLIGQMGEAPANAQNRGAPLPAGQSRLRFVPIHRNPKALLEEVERLWPMIRSNPIQVINPKEINQRPVPQPNPSNDTGIIRDPAVGGKLVVSLAPSVQEPNSLSAQSQEPAIALAPQPPVVIVTGDSQWTLASDDPDAVARLEQLLATLLNPVMEPYATAGNYSVYILRHADAKQLAELLADLFRTSERGSRTALAETMQRLKIVADTRINALVIGGNRPDRRIIEELLGVFDSKDLIDRLQRITPILVPLQNASAKGVSDICKEVYKSQLSSGAGRDPLDIPEGVSTDVATILQQINAQASAPLLSLSIDEASNSLVLRGPTDLTDEVKTFIASLDRQSEVAPSRRIQVLRLESTNSKNLEKALKLLYGK
ncbi:MAG: hypothetical protein FJ308_08850, partial [Planctomycetes bacterium]|nr:hypothetical protein [Planctomycetota bacterium]